jgi:hypothetical protein
MDLSCLFQKPGHVTGDAFHFAAWVNPRPVEMSGPDDLSGVQVFNERGDRPAAILIGADDLSADLDERLLGLIM